MGNGNGVGHALEAEGEFLLTPHGEREHFGAGGEFDDALAS